MNRPPFLLLALGVAYLLSGCATGDFTYYPSDRLPKVSNTIEIDKSKEDTWNKLISGVSSTFFVINNMDKQSGFVNLSYSGDPEQYIDGGELCYTVSNLRGERTYRFPASRANAQYEAMLNGVLCGINRQLGLEGRINVLLAEVGPTRTRLVVNTRYVLTLKVSGQTYNNQVLTPYEETISFNTGSSTKSRGGAEYRSNGRLEAMILDLFR